MLRRTCFNFEVLVSCWVAFCIRSPNCSFSSSPSSVLISAGVLAASAFVASVRFIVPLPSTDEPMDECRPDRQLRRAERERLAGDRLLDTVHLVEHLAR